MIEPSLRQQLFSAAVCGKERLSVALANACKLLWEVSAQHQLLLMGDLDRCPTEPPEDFLYVDPCQKYVQGNPCTPEYWELVKAMQPKWADRIYKDVAYWVSKEAACSVRMVHCEGCEKALVCENPALDSPDEI